MTGWVVGELSGNSGIKSRGSKEIRLVEVRGSELRRSRANKGRRCKGNKEMESR